MPENPIEKVKVLAESAPPSVGMSATWNYGNTMFVIVLGLLLTPYQLGKLGVEFYGVIMLEMALLSIATLINTSLVKTMVVMAGGKDALSWTDGDKIAKYASFVVCAAGAFAAWLILPGLNIPAGGLTQARWLMVVFCVSQALSIIVATSQARLMLCQRFDLLNKALIAGQVVQCVVIVALFELFRPSLVLHGLAVLAAAATSRFLIWRYMTTYISVPVLESQTKAFALDEFMKTWIQLAGIQVAAVFSSQGIQLAANWFGGATANAIIGLLMVIRGAVGRLNDGVANAVFSALATVYPHNEARTRSLWLLATRGVALLSLPFVIALALLPDSVAIFWLGSNGDVVARYLPLVALDIWLPSLALISVQLMQLGATRRLLMTMDFGMMATILCSVLILGNSGGGSAGILFLAYAGWRSIYGVVILFGVGARVAFCRRIDVMRSVISPMLVCGIPAAGVVWISSMNFFSIGSNAVLITSALMAAVVYLPLLWRYGLDCEMRDRLLERLGRGRVHAG